MRLTAYSGQASDLPATALQDFIDAVTVGEATVPIGKTYTLFLSLAIAPVRLTADLFAEIAVLSGQRGAAGNPLMAACAIHLVQIEDHDRWDPYCCFADCRLNQFQLPRCSGEVLEAVSVVIDLRCPLADPSAGIVRSRAVRASSTPLRALAIKSLV